MPPVGEGVGGGDLGCLVVRDGIFWLEFQRFPVLLVENAMSGGSGEGGIMLSSGWDFAF